ncbi:MAG: transcription elongation factor GreB [Gammaproteobacteria bacterium]|nr:transcription elongation factor GreB [Gammaproteobacteria bacterium]
MGRYRPPSPKSSHYITPEGKQKLVDEFDYLWRTKRPEVTRALSEAAAEGDRSENAEYIYRKKELREIDRRVRYLSKRLDELIVVDRSPDNEKQVFFGAWVALENESAEVVRYRIVGPDEFDVDPLYISMDSPVARAVLRKHEGDEVVVVSPKGEIIYSILEIRYTPFD